jgi:NADPH:quinone reductase-like Zn-dependent oxidoreductase
VIPNTYDRAFRFGAQARLTALRQADKIRSAVRRAFTFEDLSSALALLASGRVTGKLVLRGDDGAR